MTARLWMATGVAVMAAMLAMPAAAGAQTIGSKLGVELDGLGGLNLVDAARTLRSWEAIGGGPVGKDEFGWPTADARTVLFDLRPVFAWAPPIDDPDKKQIDVSGTYKVSFNGQAALSVAEDPESWTVENQKYDAATNTTTLDLTLKKGRGLVHINFKKTRRTPDAKEGTGITNLRAIRPGYPADTKQTFTDAYLKALKPFAFLRYMDFTNTNGQSKDHGAYPKKVLWKNRTTPAHCTQDSDLDHKGGAWEYVVELANTTGKDAWINVPVEADDEYVRELAKLLKSGLKPGIKLYLEHGNEVWNYSFPACTWNTRSAQDEVARGGSNLAGDGKTDSETVRGRRHGRRLVEITRLFLDEFGKDAFGQRLRPVLAWWVIRPEEYERILDWVNKTYGSPKGYFWAIASTGYFYGVRAPMGNVDETLRAQRASCDDSTKYWAALDGVALKWGLKHVVYEGGPDNSLLDGSRPGNVEARIRANRDPRMGDLVRYQVRDNWFGRNSQGVREAFTYFSLCGLYSRYGCWGATDDMTDLTTPKYKALVDLSGETLPPSPAATAP